MNKRLYVGNLSYTTDEEHLRLLFEGDGRRVEHVKLVKDRETGLLRGFAFVEMATEADAQSAVNSLNGIEFGGRYLIVNEAQQRSGGGASDSQRPAAPPARGTASGSGGPGGPPHGRSGSRR